MIDVHCHLNFPQYTDDLDNVIEKAKNAGVEKIINVGTSIEASQKVIELAKKYDNLYAIVGIHPHDAERSPDNWEETLNLMAREEKVLGIGEIGLDYYQHEVGISVDHNVQKEVFEKQIEIAHQNNLPIQIHNRQAGEDIVEILKKNSSKLRKLPGMFHCMSGDLNHLKNVLELGFYVGYDGNITYSGIAKGETTELSELIRNTPIERIVTETDAPFLTPIPHRGSRNEPSYVIIVANSIAEIKSLDVSLVAEKTTENARRLFSL